MCGSNITLALRVSLNRPLVALGWVLVKLLAARYDSLKLIQSQFVLPSNSMFKELIFSSFLPQQQQQQRLQTTSNNL